MRRDVKSSNEKIIKSTRISSPWINFCHLINNRKLRTKGRRYYKTEILTRVYTKVTSCDDALPFHLYFNVVTGSSWNVSTFYGITRTGVTLNSYFIFTDIQKYWMYCIVWRGGHCWPMHCDLFKICCAPPNLDIRMWICRLNFAYCFQAWGSLTSLISQTRDPQFKVPPGGLCAPYFYVLKKSIDPSRVWTREPWISRQARYSETTSIEKI